MTEIEIKLPKSIDDCTPDQLAKWIFLSNGTHDLQSLTGKLDFRVQVVAIFSGVSRALLESTDFRDINAAFKYLLLMLTDYEQDEPTGEVTIDGAKYIFDKDFKTKSTGQIIDLKLIEDVYSDPALVVATLYIEEGFSYNQLDDKEVVLNPVEKRRRIFKDSFPGREFLNVFGFFLSSYMKRKDAILALETAKTMITLETTKKELKEEMEQLTTARGTTGRKTS